MARLFSAITLTTLMAAGCAAVAPLCMAQEAEEPATEQREQARRLMAMRDAMQQVQEARTAYAAKRYTDAVEHYRNALSVLPKAPATKQQEQFIRDSLSDALIARAIDYRSVGRREEAVKFLCEAIELSPTNTRAKQELSATEDPVRNNPALTPEHVGRVEEVNRLLTLGQGYYDLGKYDDADRTFRAVLQHDPYNTAAQRGMEQCANARARYGSAQRQTSRTTMLNEVGRMWDISQADTAVPEVVRSDDASGPAVPDSVELAHARTLDQMQVPTFVLDDATIDDAISTLNTFVRRFEDSGTQSQRHINVTTDFGALPPAELEKVHARRISLSLSNITLKQAMDEIARAYGLEYYFDPTGVSFAVPGHGALAERTFYGVASHLFEGGGKSSSDDEDGEDEEEGGFGSRMKVRRVDPVAVLKANGVSFPKGAYASYHPSSRTLRVKNTQHNLSLISDYLNDRPEKEWQVVLNIMVVEVNQDDLEDLGFDWLLNMRLSPTTFLTGGVEQQPNDHNAIGMNLSENQKRVPTRQNPLATGGLRSLTQVTNGGDMNRLISLGSVASYAEDDTAAARSPSIFGVRGVWKPIDVTMIMRGLSQKTGTDTMHTPRLVIDPRSEEAVTFANVREIYVPQNYDPPRVVQSASRSNNWNNNNWGNNNNNNWGNNRNNNSSGMAIAVGAQPTDFVRYGVDEENMGGIGSVVRVHKAEPSPDGRNVRLVLTTVVNDFEGFIDWGSPIYAAMWSEGRNERIERVFLSPNHIFQPIFKRYLTNTDITVANGAVLVMGGLKEARVVRYEDKVPVLGDLPLVGRLFRSEGEKSSRRALMIFAKVNVVDPTGRDIRSDGGENVAAEAPL